MRIQTERLSIKLMEEKDYQDFNEILTDFRVGEYSMYNPPLPEDEEGILEYFDYYLNDIKTYGIYLGDEMIGIVSTTNMYVQIEIGYMFKTKYQGKGYAYEGAKAVVSYLVNKYSKRGVKITAGTALKNDPSIKLLNKLGFKCVSVGNVCFDEITTIKGCNFVLGY